jgi:SGNH domain (fused to AT3 domains)
MRNYSPRLRTALGWVGVAAIAAAAMLFSSSTPFPGYAALLPTIGSALVIAAGVGNPRLRFGASRALSVAPMRFIGDRSYTFYLWHWPFLIIALQYAGHELSLLTNLILLAAAFATSVFTYALFENPIRRARWDARTTVALWPASAAAVMFIAGFLSQSIDDRALAMTSHEPAGTAVILQTPAPASRVAPRAAATSAASESSDVRQSLPAVVAAVQAARRATPIPGDLSPPVTELLNPNYAYSLNRLPDHPGGCAAGDGQTTSAICRLGIASSRKSIVVLGDSHAEMWVPVILSVASDDGFAVVPLVKSGCTPDKWRDRTYSTPGCRDWYGWAIQQAKALRPNVMLIAGASSGALGDQAAAIVRAYTSSATAMKPFSKNVVILADAAGVDRQPVDCLLARHATMRTCTTTWPEEHFYASHDIAVRATRDRVGFIDTKGWFCFENECPTVVGHTVVYRDTGHITKEYALTLASAFRQAFERASGSSS